MVSKLRNVHGIINNHSFIKRILGILMRAKVEESICIYEDW